MVSRQLLTSWQSWLDEQMTEMFSQHQPRMSEAEGSRPSRFPSPSAWQESAKLGSVA